MTDQEAAAVLRRVVRDLEREGLLDGGPALAAVERSIVLLEREANPHGPESATNSTPDLDEIRRALAAAPMTQIPLAVTTTAECYGRDPLDLPPGTSLDQLWCVYDRDEDDPPWIEGMEKDDAFLVANAPTWLADLCDEVERFEDQIGQLVLDGSMVNAVLADRRAEIADRDKTIDGLVAERDAALSEVERLRKADATLDEIVLDAVTRRDAWRACADQLAAHLDTDHVDCRADCHEALAVYERLKAGTP